jgi:hypothetical protein
MNQRVVVSLSAVALVAVAAGGAALAARSSGSSHTPKTITIQGADAGSSATTMAGGASASFAGPNPNVTFVLAGDLPLLDGDRPAWHLAANSTADLTAVAALAKTLGLQGDAAVVDGGWQVGDQNSGHGLFVSKAPGLPWNYSNFDAQASYACAGSATTAADGPGTIMPPPPDCVPPPPPAGVPTKDEALAKAGDLLKALGVDAGSLTITANASEWSADVQGVPSLDGIPTPSLTTSFGFGGGGKLQYANGYLLAPEKADSYPRIGTLKAFDSLKAGSGPKGVGYPTGFSTPATTMSVVATDNPVAAGGTTATTLCVVMGSVPNSTSVTLPCPPVETTLASAPESSYATVSGTNCMAYDPASGAPPPPSPVCMCASATDAAGVPATTVPCGSLPCEPPPPTTSAVDQPMSPSAITCGSIVCGYAQVTTIPGTAPADASTAAPLPLCPEPAPPEPVTITITGVHETLLSFRGSDGSMWLVPGYEFTATDGGTYPVLAIDQSFVDQVAPVLPIPETAVAMGSSSAPPMTTAGG